MVLTGRWLQTWENDVTTFRIDRTPLIEGDSDLFTPDGRCPICRKPVDKEESDQVAIHVAATKATEDGHGSFPSDDLEVMFAITSRSGSGKVTERDVWLPLAFRVKGGQCQFRFCSTHCCRSFLTACIDALESQ